MFPDDGCHKHIWEFSPFEEVVTLDAFLDEEKADYIAPRE